MHWVRLVRFHVNEARALTAKRFAYGLLLIVLLKLAFIEVRGTRREYSSKPLKHSIVTLILVFKRYI